MVGIVAQEAGHATISRQTAHMAMSEENAPNRAGIGPWKLPARIGPGPPRTRNGNGNPDR